MSENKKIAKDRLTELNVAPEHIDKIIALGAETEDDLLGLTEKDLVDVGMPVLKARGLLRALTPAIVVARAPDAAPAANPAKELAEGEKPTTAHMNTFAQSMGMDPMMLVAFMSGGGMGGQMDISGMIPIASVVTGYNPRRRDMFLMVMGQIESRLGGTPIVVIDSNGAINRELTVEYINDLEQGFEPFEDNIHFDKEGTPRELIKVGVDAQSVGDTDPLDPERALRQNGIGKGRVNWTNVPLEVRQVAFLAVVHTKEIDANVDADWVRDHVKPGANKLTFQGKAPRAVGMFNEKARIGDLPTLRKQLGTGPRRPEMGPRRRRAEPRDLTGIGQDRGQDGGYGDRDR